MIVIHRAEYEEINFPAGEPHVRISKLDPGAGHITIEYLWDADSNLSEDIMRILLAADAIKRQGGVVYNIIFDYLPFARQDRVATSGDAFALKVFADLINSVGAEIITLVDPHSRVAIELFNNVQVIDQHQLLLPSLSHPRENMLLISPDDGAADKTKHFGLIINHPIFTPVLYCTKTRDPVTGRLGAPELPEECDKIKDSHCVIVDDICDGGGTFIALAQKLREFKPQQIDLVVSHGLFTKGLSVFDDIIDNIYVRSRKVK